MHGMSLVELMVAITIGLIILAAVSSLFVSSKQTYTTQDNLARLQENARFAMQFLTKDLRLAGYYGCVSDIAPDSVYSSLKSDSTVVNGTTANFAYNIQTPLEGLDNKTTGTTWLPSAATTLPTGIVTGTDAIVIRAADASSTLFINSEMVKNDDALTVNALTGLSNNDIIMVSDCASADIMQITSLASPIAHDTTGGTPGNSTKTLSKVYSPTTGAGGTRVMKFMTHQYFIKTGASGNPALFLQENTATPVELVDGIENMQILYGEYTDSPPDTNKENWAPRIYRKAPDVVDWSKVVSARIGILARTLNDKGTDKDNTAYDIDGDGVTDFTAPGDRYRRRVFQATVQLRNMR